MAHAGWLFAAPLVLDRLVGIDLVIIEGHFADLLLEAYAGFLFSFSGCSSVADRVVFKDQVASLAAHANSSSVLLEAVILNHVRLEPVSMAGHSFGFIAKKDAILVVAANDVIA